MPLPLLALAAPVVSSSTAGLVGEAVALTGAIIYGLYKKGEAEEAKTASKEQVRAANEMAKKAEAAAEQAKQQTEALKKEKEAAQKQQEQAGKDAKTASAAASSAEGIKKQLSEAKVEAERLRILANKLQEENDALKANAIVMEDKIKSLERNQDILLNQYNDMQSKIEQLLTNKSAEKKSSHRHEVRLFHPAMGDPEQQHQRHGKKHRQNSF